MLLDEQLVAYNAILDAVGHAGTNQQNVVFLIEGGPGTGKSVIALNLVAELAERGLSTLHLTGSKAFTENLRKIVGGRAGALFKYFRDTATVTDKLDVAILDEAHRIRTISTSRFTPAKARTGKSQIDDILDSSRVTVFFIDDLQVVRPGEVGSTDLIREEAAKRSIEVRDFKLEAQFRSNGSDSFIQWVDNTLELNRTPQVLWSMDDEFDFQIVGSIGQLEQKIRAKAAEPGTTARLVAGFCWPWSDPDDDGQLVPDVRVGEWSMPWNARDGVGRLGPGIPKSDFWASAKEGIDQVGCVYTAQGFEFDYVGVIVGPDLVYRPMDGGWVGQRDQSHDRVVRRGVTEAEFTRYVKSTYRVLLTRGLRGCYVYFMDAPTRDFFLSSDGTYGQRPFTRRRVKHPLRMTDPAGNTPAISRATRKNVLDWLRVRNVNPSGALDEESFLDRFVDLDDLPSTDARFDSARYDLRQHRFANYDWDDDWIYSYPPLDLLNGQERDVCPLPDGTPTSNCARRQR